MYIGITKAFLTHSQWEQYCFNQKTTPYTEEGRKLYLQKYKMKKKLPMDRPPLYDVDLLVHLKDEMLNNFEYFMRRGKGGDNFKVSPMPIVEMAY